MCYYALVFTRNEALPFPFGEHRFEGIDADLLGELGKHLEHIANLAGHVIILQSRIIPDPLSLTMNIPITQFTKLADQKEKCLGGVWVYVPPELKVFLYECAEIELDGNYTTACALCYVTGKITGQAQCRFLVDRHFIN